jgi:hypothetical protein
MKKLLTILAIASLVLIAGLAACGKMGGGAAAGAAEEIMDLKDRVEVLEADIEAIAVSLTELQDEYDEHMEKQHGTKPAEREPIVVGGGAKKPPREKIK